MGATTYSSSWGPSLCMTNVCRPHSSDPIFFPIMLLQTHASPRVPWILLSILKSCHLTPFILLHQGLPNGLWHSKSQDAWGPLGGRPVIGSWGLTGSSLLTIEQLWFNLGYILGLHIYSAAKERHQKLFHSTMMGGREMNFEIFQRKSPGKRKCLGMCLKISFQYAK